jgi:hypothetical protein
MKTFALVLSSFLFASTALADVAKIFATNSDGETVEISLNSRGIPRVNGTEKTYPTIKDFREDAEFFDPCYTGPVAEAKDLLDQLVEAADGDGDSWVLLKSIRAAKNGVITLIAQITDESGEYEESFVFPRCE